MVKMLLSFWGVWITPICFSKGAILLPEFGHQIPLALLNRFIRGGAKRMRYETGFGQLSASFEWRGYSFAYRSDDWGGAQIEGDTPALANLFVAMSQSPRTRVRNIYTMLAFHPRPAPAFDHKRRQVSCANEARSAK